MFESYGKVISPRANLNGCDKLTNQKVGGTGEGDGCRFD
jgi:hypothetical protein